MNIKEIINTYLNIIKTKYICFEGTGTRQEFIYFLAVWIVGDIAMAIVATILGIIGLGFIGAILCAVWNLANVLPGLGALVRFLNSKKAN